MAFDSKHMYCMDAATGALQKKINLGKEELDKGLEMGMSAAVVWKEFLFSTSFTGHLFKWDPSTSMHLW